ncbi:MAG: hypothetical protein AB1489_34015 [Acidobacteriota bacterium]
MDDLEIRRYQMLTRVRDFGIAQASAFSPDSLGGELFAIIREIVKQLSEHANAQSSGARSSRSGTSNKAIARAILRENLEVISRTARSMAVDMVSLEDKFRMPRGNNDHTLLTTARAFAKDAQKFKDEFIRHELPDDFLEELNADIADFARAITEQDTTTAAQVVANDTIDEAIEQGMNALRRLDAIVRNKFRNDLAKIAAWESASHVERASRSAATSKISAPAK